MDIPDHMAKGNFKDLALAASKDSLHQLQLCLLNLDRDHCGNPTNDYVAANIPTELQAYAEEYLNIPQYVKETVTEWLIRKYAELDRRIKVSAQCKIGVGYTSC